eukprot:128240-Hanusia_phi.AAC.1
MKEQGRREAKGMTSTDRRRRRDREGGREKEGEGGREREGGREKEGELSLIHISEPTRPY